MAEDWAAVARAIDDRIHELGIKQREVAERSQVSQAIVRELQYDTTRRKRSARTLEALSVALEWHPQHLAAVLAATRPPDINDAGRPPTVDERLAAIEDGLTAITERLNTMDDRLAQALGETSGREFPR
ncbi:XRE family transcriptional regulator [Actinoalloteichus hymeniacidonis]|uniref:XRE family transcriptional regulator n=1 Tax=Actinoalloteichus hymeniacidonis TaxID=340345 RepID=A0AAC9HNY4_9PSEU|nr:XRE family transcriptional regulator [Actinoalloteichus hymeniacidonis]AOS62839.1 hypothetical protein TL08_10120 [Actinoalloteichus hymeniacidonis]MBB5909128.1 putative nucleic acid-binding Zn ribbon protein [Actinoalloteichus hymeniacidonis]